MNAPLRIRAPVRVRGRFDRPVRTPSAVSFLTVTDRQCKFPTGEPGPEMPVCGLAVTAAPYCPLHRRVAFRTPGGPL